MGPATRSELEPEERRGLEDHGYAVTACWAYLHAFKSLHFEGQTRDRSLYYICKLYGAARERELAKDTNIVLAGLTFCVPVYVPSVGEMTVECESGRTGGRRND